MREKHQLTEIEFRKFGRLAPFQGEAIAFWKWIAKLRNLDPKSIISNGQSFTGLPIGHKVYWCFPIPLKCRKKPAYNEA